MMSTSPPSLVQRRPSTQLSMQKPNADEHLAQTQGLRNDRLKRRNSAPGLIQREQFRTGWQPVVFLRTFEPTIVDWGTADTLIPDTGGKVPQKAPGGNSDRDIPEESSSQDNQQLGSSDCRFCHEPMAARQRYSSRFSLLNYRHFWIYHAKPTQEACKDLFHGPCPTCEFAEAAEPSNLCDFCRHLRLKHLLSCTDESFVIFLYFSQKHPVEQSNCSFCNFVHNCGGGRTLYWKDLVGITRLPHDILDWDYQSGNPPYKPGSDATILADNSQITCAKGPDLGNSDISLSRWIGEKEWRVARGWIDECIANHPECRQSLAHTRIHQFRLINVWKRCIEEASLDEHYVALSYVWGCERNPIWLQSTQSSIMSLKQHGSLEPTRMPQTVEDAIQACRMLGEQYLWVDQLCIIQDDGENKQHQIDRMASIYSSAKFVIIDGDGSSMGDGLAGVSRERKVTSRVTIDGIRYHGLPEDGKYACLDSTWSSRGWTFQEAVLARKRLYFSEGQLFFECQRHDKYESLLTNAYHMATYSTYRRRWAHDLSLRSMSLQRLLVLYRTRRLTHDSDTRNAFSGILEALGGLDNCVYGHPCADFDRWLLWYPITARGNKLQASVDGAIFPTWSWSSITENLLFCGLSRFILCGPLISWEYSTTTRFREIRATSPKDLVDPWRQGIAIAWMTGCIASKFSARSITEMGFSEYVEYLSERWPSFEDFWNEAFTTDSDPSNGTRDIDHSLPQSPECGLGRLSTVAQCARFGLGFSTKGSKIHPHLAIVHHRLGRVGTTLPSGPRVKLEVFPQMSSTRTTYEFIALSLHWMDYDHALDFQHVSETGYYTLRDSNGKIYSFPLQVAVMLIGRTGPIAHRIAIGFIALHKWIEAEPKWERIILE